jgi:broad specificity phosphatase PhoE
MGTLYLVRHGQASFGTDNYDQLSPLGVRQCRRLGEYFAGRGKRFDAVFTGTLARQIQSLEALDEGLGQAQAAARLPGLNEYDGYALIAAIHPEPLAPPTTPALYRHHFQLLRQGLAAWMAGTSQPAGMPSYAAFAAGVADALDQARARHDGQVLMVSSGGPICAAVVQVLGVAPEVGIDLNMRLRNSALTEVDMGPTRIALLTFNTLPHLDAEAYDGWVTYT